MNWLEFFMGFGTVLVGLMIGFFVGYYIAAARTPTMIASMTPEEIHALGDRVAKRRSK